MTPALFTDRWVKGAHRLMWDGYRLTISTFRIGYWEQYDTQDVRKFLCDASCGRYNQPTIVIGLPDHWIEANSVFVFCEEFPGVNWRFAWHWHAKYLLAEKPFKQAGMIGSHNFSFSDWTDLSIHLTRAQFRAIKRFHLAQKFMELEEAKKFMTNLQRTQKAGVEQYFRRVAD